MEGFQQDSQQDFGNKGLQDIIGKVLPYWPLFLVLTAIGAGIAYFKLRKEVPVYQAYASLMIKDDEQQSAIIQSFGGGRGGKSLPNEIALLKSRPMAKEVVKALHLYAPITMEGRIKKAQSAYTESPVVFRVPNPDTIHQTGPVHFKYNEKTKVISFDGKAYPLNQYVNTPYGVMMILENKYSGGVSNGLPMYFNLVSVAGMAGAVQGSLGIGQADDEGTVLNMTYNDQSPQRAEDILNVLVDVYNRAAITDKNKLSENTLKFLDNRLDSVKQDLDSVERKLENFKASNKIVNISSQGQQYLGNLNSNDQQITGYNLQLTVLDQVQQYLASRQHDSSQLVPAIATISDPILSGQLQRLYAAEANYAKLLTTNGPEYPTVVAARREIETIRPTLVQQLRNQRQNYEATRADLYALNNRFNGLLSGLPKQERDLLNISRQQQIKNDIYDFLLKKKEETALTYASTVADSRLVNDAQTGGIVSPNVQSTYTQYIVAFLVIGAIFVFIRENLNRNVLSKSELEKLTPTPIIADIGYSSTKEAIVVETGSRSLVAEQFRYLRTALNYVGINSTHKKILFTSSISGEGKSFITTNLGATLALTGKRVILLEMDLRKPKLSDMLGFERTNGLSDYFIGAKNIVEIVKETPIKNLHLISSGTIPPNPAELLLSGKLEPLLSELETKYDYILIDTAPVGPVTDAYIISPLCDATLYVARQGRTPRVMMQRLNEIVRNQRLKNVSLVFNGVKQKRFGSYYGYGYTYGYGYLDEKGEKKKKKKVSGL